ncbi:DUF4191 domain-containing protein [Arenivirga flava]|nr:DUF4191 domain-containing protein [Arenivirga flava]
MARNSSTPSTPKEPGRFKQMWQVFQMTRRHDATALPIMLAGFIVPVLLGVLLAFVTSAGNILGFILWILVGLMTGLLVFLLLLGRLAERAAFQQIEGQPGAVGAVLKNALRRGWRASEMPVAVNGKTQDALYRAVGKGGVVLISEGSEGRTKRMFDDERRKVARILPNVPIARVHVGPEDDAVPLHRLARTIAKRKKALNKAEILAVGNRLSSLGQNGLPIPKGVDPMRVRAQRPR